MASTQNIADVGGVVSIEIDGKTYRVASIDGTRTADLVDVLKRMLDTAREEGRRQRPAEKAA